MRTLTGAVLLISLFALPGFGADTKYRRLPMAEYDDKMQAGWIGQMAGVGWGGPTEFVSMSAIIPERKVPKWQPSMINQFGQDDLYVEMTFLRTLELHGLDASIRQAGIDFANSGYGLAHANAFGRMNVRKGIAPPDSGHPKFNEHADDIDYQIEADYAGLISPGLPNSSIQLGEVFGRLMNYGDGLYGGQFVAGMYSEAFFEKDMEKVVRAGLKCIPEGSQYHECISDVLKWFEADPDDWKATWQLVEDKYDKNKAYRRASCSDAPSTFNIDAKINGAYIAMGLLYGKGDLDDTIIISTRCGQDSDCNPSNAAGILFTSIGYSNLPERFTVALDREGRFSHTPYSYPRLVQVCKQLTRQVVVKQGGRIEEDAQEVLVIPVQTPKPTALEQCWEPGPIANSRFTEEEMAQIDPPPDTGLEVADVTDMQEAISAFAPGWGIEGCGPSMAPGLHEEWNGKENVLVTHPLNPTTPCVLRRRLTIPQGETELHLTVGHHESGDWTLVVKANGKRLLETTVGSETAENGWMDVKVDLSDFAGSEVELALLNAASDWAFEAGFWAKIQVLSN